ncbi:MAG: MFS transporter [Pseudomonadales bacterium]|nr:MFS transporter [Pseudomonadales bacterium]NIX07813.1 MFS transporter [Pseudomonadales bacterium]
MTQPRLSKATLFCYGVADLPVMLAIMPMSIWLSRFYTGDMGLSLSAVANIMLLARLFDVITDPLVGHLSDHTRTRWGRRKPWMLASLPLLMIGLYKVFLPPDGIGIWYLFSWMMVMWLGWTMLMIPYYAWAAELSDDYDERTRITGWRAVMGSVGGIGAQLIPFVALILFGFGGTANVMTMLGIAALILMPICVGATLLRVPEFPEMRAPSVPIMTGLRIMWRNGPFRRLLLAFVLSSTGLAIVMPLYIFFVEFIVEEPPANVPYMIIISSVAGFLGIPFWVWLSRHVGKHKAWIGGFLVVAAMSPMYLFLGPGDFWLMVPGIVIIGIGTGSFSALPNSMKADVIDLDTARSGKNRAAFFFSAWSLVTKLASSLGGWLALQSLALFGFDAANGAQNTPEALMGLRLTFAVLPAIIFVIAAAVIWRYPITKERQARIRAAIDRRTLRRRAAQPGYAE